MNKTVVINFNANKLKSKKIQSSYGFILISSV